VLLFDYGFLGTVDIGQNESAIINIADTNDFPLMPQSSDEIQFLRQLSEKKISKQTKFVTLTMG